MDSKAASPLLRASRTVRPAWWLLSEDLELQGDFAVSSDDAVRPRRKRRRGASSGGNEKKKQKKKKSEPQPTAEELKETAELDIIEAVKHARVLLGKQLYAALSFRRKARSTTRSKSAALPAGVWRRLHTFATAEGAKHTATSSSEVITFTDQKSLMTFLGADKIGDTTQRERHGEKATVICTEDQPVLLHYGKESTLAKFCFTYERRNAHGTVTMSS